jgi:hypothetical protein
MSQISGYRSRKRYGITKSKKNRWQSAVRGWEMRTVAPHAGSSFLQSKIAGACAQSFVVELCALSAFRKAGRISGPAQRNNSKAVVLIERARRIKFDDSDRRRLRDAASFCPQLAKTGSPY